MYDSVQEKLVKYKLDFACVGAPKMWGPGHVPAVPALKSGPVSR